MSKDGFTKEIVDYFKFANYSVYVDGVSNVWHDIFVLAKSKEDCRSTHVLLWKKKESILQEIKASKN